MPRPSPSIAGPPYDDVAARAEALARSLSTWRPAEGQPDLGRALMRVFDRMARHAVERINRVPDRSFLAFLNLVGVEPVPPRPARVPLTFALVERGGAEPIVPAGTRVGATPASGDAREIVFETALELATTRARLVAAFVVQPTPVHDGFADRTDAATGKAPGLYEPFLASDPIEHDLYIAADDLLGLPAGQTVSVLLGFAFPADRDAWAALPLSWSYWNGAAWAPLPGPIQQPSGNAWTITFPIPGDMVAANVGGRMARWIRARLGEWPPAPIPAVQSIALSAPVIRAGLAPDLALSNGRPIDISMDFFPLGERPRFNDTFYVASAEALSHPGATVTVTVAHSTQQLGLKRSDAPKLAWEVSTASGWASVVNLPTEPTQQYQTNPTPPEPILNDALRTMENITLPANVASAEVAGKRAHWLRIRLISGTFGKGVQTVITQGGNPPVEVNDDGYRPPLLASLTLGYETTLHATATCLSYGNFTFTEHTGAAPFTPFQRVQYPTALYLGFDRAFANRNALLFVQVGPLSIEDAGLDAAGATPPKIAWEYSTEGGWSPLGAGDETRAFAQSGLVQFIGPADFSPRLVLGRALYWLRARLVEGVFAVMPRLGRVLTNTVWGTHTATITGETLGSSDGSAHQAFTLSHRPVLEGQRIEVREPELPSAAERTEIERLEGQDAIRIVGRQERPEEIWVRWHETPDFHASGLRDRHYRLDRQTGEVRFGDGQGGMVPPRGIRSVRATVYRTGGGDDGNRPAGALSQLKTTVPYVDGVTNHLPAMGGADREAIERVKERGPRGLRHGGRAITAEDFEDLALEASPAVARAKAITLSFNPFYLDQRPDEEQTPLPDAGFVKVLIVPFSPDVPPTPTVGLLQDVEAYLRQRCPPAATLHVIGPAWIKVIVTISLVPVTLDGAEALIDRARRALEDFLHPLTGGFEGAGWALGQTPTASDIYRLAAAIPGVDNVRTASLALLLPDGTEPTNAAIAYALIYSGAHVVTLVAPQGEP